MKHVKFIKRVNKWFDSYHPKYKHWKRDALMGKTYTFLKTTSRPCNCEMCTYLKYKRTPKHKIMKDAFE
jgi:hypothetical protein